MIEEAHRTGLTIPPTLNIRAEVEKAVAQAIPAGRSKALVGIGRFEGRQFVGELAWVQKVNAAWTVTAGLSAGTAKPISGQVMIAYSK
jgi:hypothetical protein